MKCASMACLWIPCASSTCNLESLTMFRFNKSSDKFETLLGSSAIFDGHLKCTGGVRIEGEFKGKIETDGNIIVGKAAIVHADLLGHDVLVSGKVIGNIFASGQLAI